MQTTLTVNGRPVWIDEPGDEHDPAATAPSPRPIIVMLHGWPDSAALWDATVAALLPHARCVRLDLPGFGATDADAAHSLDEITALLHAVVQQVAGAEPVTLLLHDWGCLYGYHFAQRHPDCVARVVGVDVGDAGSAPHRAAMSWKAGLMVLGYQGWLALAWKIGGALGDRMARAMARLMRVPLPADRIHARMGYPYWIAWTGTHGSFRAVRPFEPTVPMLYVYGRRKPFMFQSPAWLDTLAARPGCRIVALRTGHWVMVDDAAGFHAALLDWIAATD
jgi:pimeloyl-ACP methyl ester carboxylesterase